MKSYQLFKYFRCETTPKEESEIARWLGADPGNQNRFDADRNLFEAIVLYSTGNTVLMPNAAKTVRSRRLRLLVRAVSSAAAVVLLALGSGLIMNHRVNKSIQAQTIVLNIPAGQRLNIKLHDGTSVWLNAGSRLEYPPMFGKTRRVLLEGEALFEVSHDKNHPFIVETFLCDVEVLGTKFNIIADKETNRFSAALLEGSIRVANKTGQRENIVLAPNQKVDLIGRSLHLSNLGDMDDYLWYQGILTLKGMSFIELMDKFALTYGVDITIERDDIPDIRYGGKLRVSDGVEHGLRILQQAFAFTFEKDEETNTIYIR